MLGLATQLRENGVDVILDKWNLEYGNDLHHFMETSVRESDFVVIICTPNYARKANVGSGGAGYEKQIVTGEMFQDENPSKFIPLVRNGSDREALPSFLKSKNYIDFRDDSRFEGKLKDLLHQLHGVPKYFIPKLGPSPFNSRPQASPTHVRSTIVTPRTPGLPPHLEMAMQLSKGIDRTTPPMHGEIILLIEKLKVVGPDPTASGLRVIEVPLSETPNQTWRECLRNPGILVPSFHGATVHGDVVRIRADAAHPEGDLETLKEYVQAANDQYRQRIDEIERKRKREEESSRKQEEQNKALQDRLRVNR